MTAALIEKGLRAKGYRCHLCGINYDLFKNELVPAGVEEDGGYGGVSVRERNRSWFNWKACDGCETWFCPQHAELADVHGHGCVAGRAARKRKAEELAKKKKKKQKKKDEAARPKPKKKPKPKQKKKGAGPGGARARKGGRRRR